VVTQFAGIGSFCLSLWFMSLVVKAVAADAVPGSARLAGQAGSARLAGQAVRAT